MRGVAEIGGGLSGSALMLGRVGMLSAFLTYIASSEILLASICVHTDDLLQTVFFLKFRQRALGSRRASGMVFGCQGQAVLRSQADQTGFLQATPWKAIAQRQNYALIYPIGLSLIKVSG